MDIDAFRSALKTRPFRPVKIRTGSGAEYEVRHPETVGITPSGRTIVLARDDGIVVLDAAAITEYLVAPPKRGRSAGPAE